MGEEGVAPGEEVEAGGLFVEGGGEGYVVVGSVQG